MLEIEKLREMLTKRGVKYTIDNREVIWKDKDGHVCKAFQRYTDENIYFSGISITTERAIEASLGREKCHVISEVVNEYGFAPQPTDWTWELSCGHSVTWDNLPDYCPWCGMEIENGRMQEQ